MTLKQFHSLAEMIEALPDRQRLGRRSIVTNRLVRISASGGASAGARNASCFWNIRLCRAVPRHCGSASTSKMRQP